MQTSNQQLLTEAFKYVYPKDAFYKFYDFYALELLRSELRKGSGNVEKDKIDSFSHSKNQLKTNVEEAFENVTDNIFNEMLVYLSREIIEELDYLDTRFRYEQLLPNKYAYIDIFRQANSKQQAFDNITKIYQRFCRKYNIPMNTYVKLVKFFSMVNSNYSLNINTTTKNPKDKITMSDMLRMLNESKTTVNFYLKYFNYLDIYHIYNSKGLWSLSYGGKPWARATKYYMEMHDNVKPNDLAKKAMYVDLIYDLEHNTGSILNKNDVLQIRKIDLNWRNKATDIRQYIQKYKIRDYEGFVVEDRNSRTSPQVVSLIQRYIKLYNPPAMTIPTKGKIMNKKQLKEIIKECIREEIGNGIEFFKVDGNIQEFDEATDMKSLTDLQKILNNPPVAWANKNYPGGIEAYKKMLRAKINRLSNNK